MIAGKKDSIIPELCKRYSSLQAIAAGVEDSRTGSREDEFELPEGEDGTAPAASEVVGGVRAIATEGEGHGLVSGGEQGVANQCHTSQADQP